METIELIDGGLLLYDEAFLPPDLADRYLVELRDQCVWEQKPGVFGHMQPRLTASYGGTRKPGTYAFIASQHLVDDRGGVPRTARASVGAMCYHALNPGTRREAVFHKARRLRRLRRGDDRRTRPFAGGPARPWGQTYNYKSTILPAQPKRPP